MYIPPVDAVACTRTHGNQTSQNLTQCPNVLVVIQSRHVTSPGVAHLGERDIRQKSESGIITDIVRMPPAINFSSRVIPIRVLLCYRNDKSKQADHWAVGYSHHKAEGQSGYETTRDPTGIHRF